MDFEKYKNTLPAPVFPRQPRLKDHATPSEIRAYADKVEVYEAEKFEYRTALERYNNENARLGALFGVDVLAEYGLTYNPKAQKILSFAWDKSDGRYENVYYWIGELAELIL